MAAYMRNQFPFLGLPRPIRRDLDRHINEGQSRPNEQQMADVAKRCWKLREREYQYFGCDYLQMNVRLASGALLADVKSLVATKSWWDTVDTLASRVVGPLVLHQPGLANSMDNWVRSQNLWIARTAIIHQLTFGESTDQARLFDYCLLRAGDKDFFIRKAIGWALRQYSKTDAVAVRKFVRQNNQRLSPLSVREALKWLENSKP